MNLRSLLVVVLALGAACSSTNANTAGRVVSAPFTPDLAPFFDDAVDYVENVEDLGGRVASDWRRQIDGLSRNSDVIGVVRIETVTSGSESSSSGSFRLTTVSARAPFKGVFPPDGRIDLRVLEGEVGYNTVRNSAQRLQANQWLLFVRWYDDADGQVRPHWHLTPATTGAIQRAQDAFGYVDPNAPREQVVRPVTN
ncbi:MAG: hypothetical protein U0326_08715 [Polyangiales bacterium]